MKTLLLLIAMTTLTSACASKVKDETTLTPKTDAQSAANAQIKATSDTPKVQSQTARKVECSTKGDMRTLEIRSKDKGCELAYVKGGQEGIVATSLNGYGHCETTLKKIQDRLAGAGFACKQ